jgi:stalled ribosome rescue protein Dom34
VVTKAGFTVDIFLLIRKVQTESATGSVSVNKVRTTLTIKVETIDFDTQGCVLRVKGRNIQENQYVKVKLSVVNVECRLLKKLDFHNEG